MQVKMHSAGDQQRPSRIGGQQQQQQQLGFSSLAAAAASQSAASRLKSSSIAKVPLAKSRLRQPVAALIDSKKERDKQSLVRPNSLPLGCGATRRASLLPTSRTSSGTSSGRAKATGSSISKRAPTTTTITRQPGKFFPPREQPDLVLMAQQTVNLDQAVASSSCSDDTRRPREANEAGSQIGLAKNLVAVVHPQNNSSQQRVNSSATLAPSTNNKPLAASTTSTKSSQATTNSANNKLMSFVKVEATATAVESGKVNSNHKDVNGRESSAGKQDGASRPTKGGRSQLQQMLFGSQKTTTTGDQVRNVSSKCNIGQQQKLASARIATTKVERSSSERHGYLDSAKHDDRQSSEPLCNGNGNNNYNYNDGSGQQAALSVAAKNFLGDECGCDKDDVCLHHEGGKQATKRPSPGQRAFNSPLLARSTIARSSEASGRPSRDNCYNHQQHPRAKSTLAQSAAAIDDFNQRPPMNGGTFSHRLLSKPMGQQVLSLMMLDVGLMPSNSNHGQQQHQQQEQLEQQVHNVSSRSHVRIQSPPGCDEGFDDHPSARVFNRWNGHFMNRHDSDNFENLTHREQRASIPVNEMLRLKLSNLHLDNQRTKSISLPSSPRMRVHQTNHQSTINHLPYQQQQKIERVSRISPSLTNEKASFYPANRLLSPSRYGSQQNYLQRPIDQNCEDSRSISSSCSSLNHNYPPLLAISNQLNELNLHELMLQRRTQFPVQATQPSESKQNLLLLNATNTAIGQTNNNDSAIPTVVANRVAAHKSNCLETGTINDHDHHDGDGGISSNCFNACSKSKPSDTDSGYENIGDHSPGAAELVSPSSVHHNCSNQQTASNGNRHKDRESCPDPSLRQRQQQHQQQRSHSLSGQELSYNGSGYQRLNQFITQHVSPELDHHRQRYAVQTPIFQPSQQQQHLRAQLSARSPSPLSYSVHIDQNRDISSNHQKDIQKPRNQLHASLECLNSSYLEYQHQQQQHNQFRQQQQMNLQNQHYAATNYILATPPANTVVNQSGDQDLAAAAMDNNSLAAHHQQQQQQYQHLQQSAGCQTPNNIYAHQSIINRAMAQVHQSPARRFSSAQHGGTGMASTLISNLTNLHHPMRAGHSSLSLSSSSYIIEDKLQNEIKKLHSELKSEKDKNEALNSQLNINSNLMAAFEQSLTTLNSRLRQLTTINERKDQEIEELRVQLSLSKLNIDEATDDQFGNNNASPSHSDSHLLSPEEAKTSSSISEKHSPTREDREDLVKVVEDLKRQLIEKDRLLTDTRLEALSAAHQLEQLESRLDKEHRSIVVNEDDLDEGVMVVNHSSSDSDAVTDSALFSEINVGQTGCKAYHGDIPVGIRVAFDSSNVNNTNKSSPESSPECNNNNNNTINNINAMMDSQSSHSSDYQEHSSAANEVRARNDDHTNNLSESVSQQFSNPETDTSPMDRLMDSLLSSAS